MVSSGASSRSRVPSRTPSKAQTEVEVALSEGDDEFLEIEVFEPDTVVKNGDLTKPPISPIRAPDQSPQLVPLPSPMPSLQSGQIPPPDVEVDEEPAGMAEVYTRTGERVAGVIPPPPPIVSCRSA